MKTYLRNYKCKQCGALIDDSASNKDLHAQFFCHQECEDKYNLRFKKHISSIDQRIPRENEY